MNGVAPRPPESEPSVAARAIAIRVARAWRRRATGGGGGAGRVALAGFGSEVLLGADDGDRSENSRREFEGEPSATFASATSVKLATTTTTTTTPSSR